MKESKEAGVETVNTSFWSAQNVYGAQRTGDHYDVNEAVTPTVAALLPLLEEISVVLGIQHSSTDFVNAFFSISTNQAN